ncbi:Putative ribonuclease H protein [Dendrobium catenatum]|uniref:Ribonuclease H protein n=1 Tax=Dendrobium catenatum TaxID=906689 RepID=A0A2I0W5R0_9ASPA|nr:Putative ribonuclease H protein [Dendrobium catenatum]
MWRADIAQFTVVNMMDQCMIGQLTLPGLRTWTVAIVYANKDFHVRRLLWDTIGLAAANHGPMIVGGDFNCCLSQEEKKGGKRFRFSAGAQEMVAFMGDNDLHDIGFEGPRYTWSNNKDGASRIWVRLDRVLMNSEGLAAAPFASVRHLSRVASDHCPLLLHVGRGNNTPNFKWTRFEDVWKTYPASWRVVHDQWSKRDFGRPAEVLNRKCSRTLKSLVHWSRNRIRELGIKKEQLEGKIGELQEIDCTANGLSTAQEEELRCAVGEFNATLARISVWWRQRAKIRWIEEGDANSHFFHMAASARRRANRVAELKCSDGVTTRDPTVIQEEFWNFFVEKWKDRQTNFAGWPRFDVSEGISDHSRQMLDAAITEADVQAAVFSLGNNRAPGMDGITSSFLKFYWTIIKNDVCCAVLDFFSNSLMCPSWKDTIVILLPKNNNANCPAHFRPISLCQTFYKVVAKILVNRLKPVLMNVISEEQGAFVPGRSISNHGLIAQEVMCKFQHSTKCSGLMALKIDMQQAYDCMAWDTLHRVMSDMGFSMNFIRWITECVTNPRFAFVLNGNRSHWINAASGFRQGCPLSPYLFILCSELLSKAFRQRGDHLGVQIVPNGERVSHLLYADDIVAFAEASVGNAKRIQGIFKDYCAWTGQVINQGKSAVLFNKRCPRWRCRRIARLLGFGMVTSLEYLGLPLVMRRLVASDFANLLRKAAEKVQVWGRRHLSLAGRATLIRTALLNTPMYCLTLTSVPRSVLAKVDKIGRQFLWWKDGNHRGTHYVAWDELCRPTSQGGLGFHSTMMWQGPLRAKLAWNFINEPGMWLHRLLREKYGDDPWRSTVARNVSVTWKVIQDGATAIRPILRWTLGNGEHIDLCRDVWILDRRLAEWPCFGDFTAIEDWKVGQLLDPDGDWRRDLVTTIFGEIMAERICAIPTGRDRELDKPELINSPLAQTITSMAYNAKVGSREYHYQWLRRLRLHPREKFFWWRLLRDAIPTNCWLFRRGLADSPLCPWGCNTMETVEHCCLQCNKVKQINDCLVRWGINLPSPTSLEGLIERLEQAARSNPISGQIICYVVYQAWRARNDMKHGRAYGSPLVLATNVLSALPKSTSTPPLEQWCTNQPIGLPSHKLWCAPPPNWLKVNFDGALLQSNRAGLGVVIRDHEGKLVVAAGHQIEHWDATTTELFAAQAIHLVIEDWMLDRDGLIVEGDSLSAINWLRQMCNPTGKIHRMVDGPNVSFLCSFKQVIFQHINRHSNRPADFCAHLGILGNFLWKNIDCVDIPLTFVHLLREESDRV